MTAPETARGVRRWWEEHSELDTLVAVVVEALGRGEIAPAARGLEDLSAALETHFGIEESAYFPMVERLSPEHGTALHAAQLSHRLIRKSLEDLRALIDGGDLAAARSGLDVLLERFRSHEVEEAKLIARLEELSTR